MKIINTILIILAVILGVWFFMSRTSDVAVVNFEECVAQGNPVMESYPRQCRDSEGNLFVEKIDVPSERIFCDESQRDVDACIEIYQPVCATVNVQCITTPCDPIQETYSNSCFACDNPLVESYVTGECDASL